MLSHSDNAFHLARNTEDGFVRSPYGYLSQEAANNAAPTLNRTRIARGYQHYTHVLQFQGSRAVDVQTLEEVA